MKEGLPWSEYIAAAKVGMNIAHLLGFLFGFGVVGLRPSAAALDDEAIPSLIAGVAEIEKESLRYSK